MWVTAVIVDFSRPRAPPLMKKYGLFNSGLVGASDYTECKHVLENKHFVLRSSHGIKHERRNVKAEMSLDVQYTGAMQII